MKTGQSPVKSNLLLKLCFLQFVGSRDIQLFYKPKPFLINFISRELKKWKIGGLPSLAEIQKIATPG